MLKRIVCLKCFFSQNYRLLSAIPNKIHRRNFASKFDKNETLLKYLLKPKFQVGTYEHSTVMGLFEGICSNNRSALAESITLVESTHPGKMRMSQVLLQMVLEKLRKSEETDSKELVPNISGSKSVRIGVTGPPGAGKSLFIEKLGVYLTQEVGVKVAVLAIDPSSNRTGGSLLGDKTRMSRLSVDPRAYVRPSPARGELGGVARNTMEALLLCEGSGYDVIIVETVGVGQSEVAVGDMTDIFVLVIPPAGGDELQGLKRGIIENCDVILVNKSDGDLVVPARRIQTEYTSALKFIPRKYQFWRPRVSRISALTESGIDESWKIMMSLYKQLYDSGILVEKRRGQSEKLMWSHVRHSMEQEFRNNSTVKSKLPLILEKVSKGEITPGLASDILVQTVFGKS